MRGIFIELSDIKKIFGYQSDQGAHKRLTLIRDCLGKKDITIREFCEFEQITEEDFKKGIQAK